MKIIIRIISTLVGAIIGGFLIITFLAQFSFNLIADIDKYFYPSGSSGGWTDLGQALLYYFIILLGGFWGCIAGGVIGFRLIRRIETEVEN